jgi:hypothetical protein
MTTLEEVSGTDLTVGHLLTRHPDRMPSHRTDQRPGVAYAQELTSLVDVQNRSHAARPRNVVARILHHVIGTLQQGRSAQRTPYTVLDVLESRRVEDPFGRVGAARPR